MPACTIFDMDTQHIRRPAPVTKLSVAIALGPFQVFLPTCVLPLQWLRYGDARSLRRTSAFTKICQPLHVKADSEGYESW